MYEAEREHEILQEAIAAFRKITGFEAKVTELQHDRHQRKADAMLVIKTGDWTLEYLVEIKSTITRATIGLVANQLKQEQGKWLLVTRHTPMNLAKTLRDLEIAFLDTVGNGYINEPPVYIYIQGNKLDKETWQEGREDIFGRAGLQVVFTLLCKKDLENAPLREIAKMANVALGTIARIFKGLIRKGFLIDMGTQGRRLIKKKELLNLWATNYADKLRPQQFIGRYETDHYERLLQADLGRLNAQWGGEVAADLLTNYLKPQVVTIYAQEQVNNLLIQFRLHKNPQGRIEIRRRFWNFDEPEQKNTVHPILVYADLLATGDPRNIETARIIYDKFIDRFIRED